MRTSRHTPREDDPLVPRLRRLRVSPCPDTCVRATKEEAIARLNGIRLELNSASQFLDARPPNALRVFDAYRPLRKLVVDDFGAQCATNAWLKMVELLGVIGPLPDIADGPRLRVFCNAELPGGFLCALNHVASTRFPEMKLDWAASSLFPEDERALSDKFHIYSDHKDRWVMDESMRGDMTVPEDVKLTAERAVSVMGGPADLYTSDLGLGLSGGYDRQEELTLQAHVGQTVAGLLSLRRGGIMVVKTFTVTCLSSIGLLGVLMRLFASVEAVKPATSRPTNSEIYLVCSGFSGLAPRDAESLLEAVARPESLEPHALKYAVFGGLRVSEAFHAAQASALRRAERQLRNHDTDRYRRMRKLSSLRWVRSHRLKPIDERRRL